MDIKKLTTISVVLTIAILGLALYDRFYRKSTTAAATPKKPCSCTDHAADAVADESAAVFMTGGQN